MSGSHFLLLLLLSFSLAAAAVAQGLSVYDVLQSYDFPIGLLPIGITKYEINPSTGRFSVHLNQICTFSVQGYDLKYHTTITGTVSKDRITNISGIQVKILFWFNIVSVSRSDKELDFSIGILSASFPIDSFLESPQCGCGFDCMKIGEIANSTSNVYSM